jgi:hypothetical protein
MAWKGLIPAARSLDSLWHFETPTSPFTKDYRLIRKAIRKKEKERIGGANRQMPILLA